MNIDLNELLTRVDHDRELLQELLVIFKHEFLLQQKALQQAVEHGDCKQTAEISHTLKGMLSNLAATKAATCAAQIEQLARAEDTKALKEAVALFERAVQGLLPEIETYMGEVRQ